MGSLQKNTGYYQISYEYREVRVTATDEVESHNIVISFSCIEFDSKSPWITSKIRKLSPESYSRKPHEDWSLHILSAEKVGLMLRQKMLWKCVSEASTLVKSDTSAVVSK